MATAMNCGITDGAVGYRSTTLTTAGLLVLGTSGSNTTNAVYARCGQSTGYGQMWGISDSSTVWPALGSIGNPDAKGNCADATTLEGQRLEAGTFAPTVRLVASAGTVTADIYVRLFKYTPSSGVYTLVYRGVKTGQTITTSNTNFTSFTADYNVPMSFETGDKLYLDVWLNITANNTGSSTATIKRSGRQSTTQYSNYCYITTPGYSAYTRNSRTISSVTACLGNGATTYNRTVGSVSAALLQAGLTRGVTPVTAATIATLERGVSSVTAATKATLERGVTPVTAALQGGTARAVTPVTAALKAEGLTRTVASVTAALKAEGLSRPVSSVTAILAVVHTRSVSSVTANLITTQEHGVTPVTAALKAEGLTRTISSVTASLQATSTYLLEDDCNRSESGTWGTASDSHTWTMLETYGSGGQTQTLGVNGSALTVSGSGGSGYNTLGEAQSVTARDAEAHYMTQVGNATSGAHAALFRWSGTGSSFTGYRVGWSGGNLSVTRYVSGTATNIATSPAVTQAVSTWYHWKSRVTLGSNPIIQVKHWTDGSSEPADWEWTFTDTGSTVTSAGWMGLRCYTTSGTGLYDNVTFTALPLTYSRTISSVTACLSGGSQTYNRTVSSVTAALIQAGLTRGVTGVTAATLATLTRPIASVTAAIATPGLTRAVEAVTAALIQEGLTRGVSSVTAATQATLARSVTPVTAALVVITQRTIQSVTAATQATHARTVSNLTAFCGWLDHAPGAYRLVVTSDPEYDGTTNVRNRGLEASQLAYDFNPDAVVFMGDLLDGALDTYAPGVSNDFDHGWGRLKAKTWLAWGNHDTDDNLSATESYYSSVASQIGGTGKSAGEHYHAHVLSNGWLAIFLDFHEDGSTAFPSGQLTWLQGVLDANPDLPTIVFCHSPAYTGGSQHTPETGLRVSGGVWAELQAHGADLFCSGHNHVTERFALQDRSGNADATGIRQMVGGPGGKNFHTVTWQTNEQVPASSSGWGTAPQSPDSPPTDAQDAEFGMWLYWLYPDRYEWEWWGIDGYHHDSGVQYVHNPITTTYERTVSSVTAATQATVSRSVTSVTAATLATLERSVSSLTAAAQATLTRGVTPVTALLAVVTSHTVSSVTVALIQAGLTRGVTPVTAATRATLAHSVVSVTAALQGGTSHAVGNITAALLQAGLTRGVSGVTTALIAQGLTRPVAALTTALKAEGLTRPVSSVTAALKAEGLLRGVSSVTAATQATLTRGVTPLTAATLATPTRNVSSVTAILAVVHTRSVSSVTAATKAEGLTRPVASVTAAAQATLTRHVTSITATLQGGTDRQVPVSAALIALETQTVANVTAILSVLRTRAVSSVTTHLRATLERGVASVTAVLAVTHSRTLSSVTAATQATEGRTVSTLTAHLQGGTAKAIPATAALVATLTRGVTPITAATLATLTRGVTSVTVATQATLTRGVGGVTAALKATDLPRQVVGLDAALRATLTRGVSSVTASLFTPFSRTITPVTAATLATLERTVASVTAIAGYPGDRFLTNVTAALKATGLTRQVGLAASVLDPYPPPRAHARGARDARTHTDGVRRVTPACVRTVHSVTASLEVTP